VSSIDFAIDIGGSLKRIINLDGDLVRTLATLGGLVSEGHEELLSWTGVPIGNVRIEFRREAFVSRAVRNPKVRGCPRCLREDAAGHKGPAIQAMAMRGDWQLREVSICVRHGHPLVRLWEVDAVSNRYDIGSRLSEIESDILQGKFDRPVVKPSPYDLWLDQRLEDGRDSTWFSSQTLYAATTFCRLLGMELLRLEDKIDLEQEAKLRAAQAAGFAVARLGEEAISAAFDRLAALASGKSDQPHKAFGDLFTKLSRDYVAEECFSSFRRMLRDKILTVWPIATEETLLGEKLPERIFHSLLSAAEEIGIGTPRLDQFLTEAGAFAFGDDRPQSRKLFDAKKFAPLLEEIPTLVGPLQMCRSFGATKTELAALAKDEVILPRTKISTIKSPWRISDGVALLSKLKAKIHPTGTVDGATESILQAARRADVGIGVVIAAILSGDLQVVQSADPGGFHGLVVPVSWASAKVAPQPMQDLGMVPAAAFGRAIGMRDQGLFRSLLEAGHTPSVRLRHPTTKVHWFYLTNQDIQAFHRRFMTPTTMKAELGVHRNMLLRKLREAGVKPFTPNGVSYGTLYLRESVEPVFKGK
jgi:hypothetical protein